MILLTGAAGTSGREILKVLAPRVSALRVLVRSEARAASLDVPSNVQIACGDMHDPSTLGTALDGVTTALLISTADERMEETQCRFVDAAKANGVLRIVKFSGQEAGIGFEASAFRFGRMHDQIERHIERSGLRWTHLRPSQFMQVYLREAPLIAQGTLALPLGDVQMAPVDLRDVAQIASAIVTSENVDSESFQITGPEALTMDRVAQILSAVTHRRVSYQALSIEERSRRLLKGGTPAVFVEALEEQAVERLRRPFAGVVLSAHERFRVPPTSFEAFALRHAAVFAGTPPRQ